MTDIRLVATALGNIPEAGVLITSKWYDYGDTIIHQVLYTMKETNELVRKDIHVTRKIEIQSGE